MDEQRSGDDLHLTVTVPAQRCGEAYSKTLQRLRETVTVPGFRNNDKASDQAIIRVAGGKKEFNLMVVEELVQTSLPEVCL